MYVTSYFHTAFQGGRLELQESFKVAVTNGWVGAAADIHRAGAELNDEVRHNNESR